MEVDDNVNGDNIRQQEEDGIDGSRRRMKSGKSGNKKKRMPKTGGGEDGEEAKEGRKKKQRGSVEEAEGNDEEEKAVDGDGSAEEEDEIAEELMGTRDSLLKDVQESLVDEKKDEKKKKRKERLLAKAARASRLGICYLSRIPPHMDHVNLRLALSQYGEIQRIYLVPEGSNPMASQRKAAKHKKQSFTEGWVEFSDKNVAKRVANMLNGEQIGGKKRSQFYFDMWNIKYLSKFKWDDLTEEIAIKRATREQKLALELSAAKRERKSYLGKVEKSVAQSNIEERLKKKQKVPKPPKNIFRFHQKKPVAEKTEESKSKISRDVLAEVFGGSG